MFSNKFAGHLRESKSTIYNILRRFDYNGSVLGRKNSDRLSRISI